MSTQPTRDEKYYARLRGRVSGPFTRDELLDEMSHGRFGTAHEVSLDQKSWTLARDLVAELQRSRPRGRDAVTPHGRRVAAATLPAERLPDEAPGATRPLRPRPDVTPRQSTDQFPSSPSCRWSWTEGGYDGGKCGSILDLLSEIRAGRVPPFEFVRPEGAPAWNRADAWPELKGAWDTPDLRVWSRAAAVLGGLAVLVSFPAWTLFVLRWVEPAPLGAVPWYGTISGLVLALLGGGAAHLAVQKWMAAGAPRSSPLNWLRSGLIGSYAVAISAAVLMGAYGLARLSGQSE